ncbi:MAG TPA: AMIN domain-containing protein [Terriglobales bacterium]|nr:AMIN domain-containing protein [Terriglobales bacterium]
MRARINICCCFLFLLALMAATPARAEDLAVIKHVAVEHHGPQVQVKIVLSRPVTPQMRTASAPERVLLDFPGTSSSPHQRHITVGKDGVEAVRYGLNQPIPPVTRLVVDLARTGKYELATVGNEVTLTITPAAGAPNIASNTPAPRAGHRRSVPPAAASGVWLDLGKTDNTGSGTTTVSIALPAPPASPGSAATPATTSPKPAAPSPAATTVPAASVPAAPTASASSASAASAPTPTPPASVPSTSPAPPAAATPAWPQSTTSSAAPATPAATVSSASPQPAPVEQSLPAQAVSQASPQPATPIPPTEVQPPVTATPATTGGSSPNSASAAGSTEPQLSTRPPATPANPSDEAASPSLANSDIRTVFRVKYVADGAVYLDGGRADGLGEGVALVIKDQQPQAQASSTPGGATPATPPAAAGITAHLKVISVAQNSAVCDVSSSTKEVKPGDLAYLTSADAEALVQQRALSSTRVYPQVITFTQGDPMDEEVRDEVPRPPLPEINRTRLLIGLDYGGISSRGSSAMSSSQYGMVMRTDMTRIGGSYWNLHGYWRGEFNSQSSAAQPTMQDMINRTYTIGLTYDNPQSRFVAGVGRLYLPWATSLDVIDGGYGGVRFGKHVTTGLFAGTSPDPTSWSYNPDRRIAGNFVNFEGGSYEDLHYTATTGVGISTLLWTIDRPFVFLESGVSYKRFISVYEAMQADKPRGTPATPSPGAGVSRSYVTVRVQPIQRLSLDFNHNYFRDVPTYNLSLVGTGLLDTVLFQGFSAGARVETVKKIYLYTELGRSTRSGDTSSSLNQMYGITFGKLWNTGLHADLHYAKFNSAFARGNYRAISLSRNFGERFQGQVQVGKQSFVSPFTTDNGSKFLNTTLETQIGAHYFFAGGYNLQRGLVQNYDQWYFTLGYRFDSRSKLK